SDPATPGDATVQFSLKRQSERSLQKGPCARAAARRENRMMGYLDDANDIRVLLLSVLAAAGPTLAACAADDDPEAIGTQSEALTGPRCCSRTGDTPAYLRSDNYSAAVHVASNGEIHELYNFSSGSFQAGVLSAAGATPATGKVTAYVRADGVNAVV